MYKNKNKKIAGVGNYLLSEALYRSNLDPFSSIGEINIDQRKRLYYEVIETASASYKKQGMTRQKGGSYRDMDGNEGKFAFSLQCYGRKVCPKGRTVIQDTKGPHGRTIWYVEDQLLLPLSKRFSSTSTITKEIPKSKANVSGQNSKSISINHNIDNDNSQVLNDDLSGKDLANYLTDESWKQVLEEFLSSQKFERLSNFVSSERERNIVYPPTRDVFSALNECSFDNVKVVIIGQDPYHGPNQGHGLAFSVQEGIKIPPSLRNIFKELNTDLGMTIPSHGNLSNWSKQGILLLNTVMTVQAGKANSHSKMGWEDFTSEIVEKLNNQKEGLVFLLWGGPAAKKGKGIDEDKHFVIKTSHPSPLGATKTKSPFLVSVYLFVTNLNS
jgi:uracil-DNA glycosylase